MDSIWPEILQESYHQPAELCQAEGRCGGGWTTWEISLNLICYLGGTGGCVWDIWSDSWEVHWGAPWSLPAQLLWKGSGLFSIRKLKSTWLFPSQEQVDILMCEGFSGHQLISQLHDHTVHNDSPIKRFPTEPCLGGECLLEWPAEICHCWTPCYCGALSAWGGWWVSPGKIISYL